MTQRDVWGDPMPEGMTYPLGVPRGAHVRDEAGKIPPAKMRSPQNTSSLWWWVQPIVAGVVLGALFATVTFLSIKNSNDWLAPCTHVQQGECYEDSTVRTLKGLK